jgi:hypothetical protein
VGVGPRLENPRHARWPLYEPTDDHVLNIGMLADIVHHDNKLLACCFKLQTSNRGNGNHRGSLLRER